MANLVYFQSSGKLFLNDELLGIGYSGSPEYKNKPEFQHLKDHGCIPQGEYSISEPYSSQSKGPMVFRLAPKPGTEVFGRTAFMIHGDSIKHPGTASQGCIIMPRAVRDSINVSGVRDLSVKE